MSDNTPQSSMDVLDQVAGQSQPVPSSGSAASSWDVLNQVATQGDNPPATPPPPPETGVLASVKRNTIGLIEGMYHAFTDPATGKEKGDLLAKIQEENKNSGAVDPANKDHVPESLATDPSRATLAYHRLIDAPADVLNAKGKNEQAAAEDLIKHAQYWKGGNLYLSGLADRGLSNIPLMGPMINSIAQRGEGALIPAIDTQGNDVPVSQVPADQKDFLGAATDVGSLMALENAPKAATHMYDAATGKITQIIQGERMAQAPAQTALRNSAQAAATDAGVASTADASQGMRTVMDQHIKTLAEMERGTYSAINAAAETDLKALYDYQSELQDALDDPKNISQRDALQKELQTTQDAIKQGETAAQGKGVSPDTLQKAQAMTQQRYAMQNVKQKLFNNESVVSGNVAYGAPETINVDSAIKQVENLNKPSKYAPEGSPTRLQQAFGEQGANDLLQGLYDAQSAGTKALRARSIAKWVGGAIGVSTFGHKILGLLE